MNALNLLSGALKEEFRYPAHFLAFMTSSLIFFFLQYVFISQVFHWTPELAGWSEAEVKFVFALVVVVQLATETFAASAQEFFRQVAGGKIESHLLKPIRLNELVFLRWARPSHAAVAAFVLILSVLLFRERLFQIEPSRVALAACALFLGIISHLSFISLLSIGTFVIQRSLPVEYIHSEISRLCFLPPSIFGTQSGKLAVSLLPLIFAASVPASILLKGDFKLFYIFVPCSLFMFLTATFALRWGVKKFDGLGG